MWSVGAAGPVQQPEQTHYVMQIVPNSSSLYTLLYFVIYNSVVILLNDFICIHKKTDDTENLSLRYYCLFLKTHFCSRKRYPTKNQCFYHRKRKHKRREQANNERKNVNISYRYIYQYFDKFYHFVSLALAPPF